jgi:xylulokinase
MLDYIDISENQLPCIKSSGARIGFLTAKASAETGLSPDTIVVAGDLDQMAGAVGAGNIAPEIVSESTETYLTVCVNIKNSIPYSDDFRIPCHCNALEDNRFSLLFWSQTADVILEWFKDNFYVGNTRNGK